MQLLLAFVPFIAFVAVERGVGTLPGLVAGTAASLALLVLDRLRDSGQLRILELGTALLFGGLALWGWQFGVDAWSVAGVRLRVDLGLMLIVLASVAMKRPFTLQYAPALPAEDLARRALYLRTHTRISLVWAAAFALMVAMDLLLIYRPGMPVRFAVVVTVVALFGAAKFSTWYPQQLRGR